MNDEGRPRDTIECSNNKSFFYSSPHQQPLPAGRLRHSFGDGAQAGCEDRERQFFGWFLFDFSVADFINRFSMGLYYLGPNVHLCFNIFSNSFLYILLIGSSAVPSQTSSFE
jgi:hypothetical protein